VSHIGIDTKGLYLNESQIDPWKSTWPTSDLTVRVSYAGDSSQPVSAGQAATGAVTLLLDQWRPVQARRPPSRPRASGSGQ
jgi:hypothetical protein